MLHDVNFMEKPMPLIAKVVPLLHYFKNLCHRLAADAEVLQKDIFLEQKIYFEKGVYYAARLYHFSLKKTAMLMPTFSVLKKLNSRTCSN